MSTVAFAGPLQVALPVATDLAPLAVVILGGGLVGMSIRNMFESIMSEDEEGESASPDGTGAGDGLMAADDGDDMGGLGGLEDDDDDDLGDFDEGFDDGFDDMDEGAGGGDLDEFEHRLDEMEAEVGSLSSTVNTVRNENEQISESVGEVEENVRKLLDIYEMVTRGVNPFADDVDAGMGGGDMGGGGGFGLFEDDGGGETEQVDDDIADADAEGFFDDDLVEDEGEAELEEDFDDQFEEDFDDESEDEGGESGDDGGGTSFEDLKAEYESGDAEWADEELEEDSEAVEEDIGEDFDEDFEEDIGEDFEEDIEEEVDEDIEDGEPQDTADAGAESSAEAVDETADAIAEDDLFDDVVEADSMDDSEPETAAETAEPEPTTDDAADSAQSGKPYLDSLPGGYATDLLVFEWLGSFVEEAGVRETAGAIDYYETIDWIAPDAADELEEYLAGFDGGGSGDLTIDHHARSLQYIGELNGGGSDRLAAQRLTAGGGTDGIQR